MAQMVIPIQEDLRLFRGIVTGKDDVAAIFSVVEKRLSAATAKCQPEEGEAMEEEAAKPEAGTAELYGMVQLMVALILYLNL